MFHTIESYAVLVLAIFAMLEGLRTLRAERRVRRTQAAVQSLRRKSLRDGIAPWLVESLFQAPLLWFERLVATSGLRQPPLTVLLFILLLTGDIFAGLSLAAFPLLVVFVVPLALGCLLPLLILLQLRRRRCARLLRQLPDTVGMLVRSLRAGHPIPTGIKLIAQEMAAPIGEEFQLVHDSMSFGLSLRQALEKMSHRLHLADLHYMVAAIRIHSASGGNLADVLDSLGNALRQKEILQMKAKTLSAQARLSGNILSALPFILVFLIYRINPSYYDKAISIPMLSHIMEAAGALTFVGIVIIRRIVNIRV